MHIELINTGHELLLGRVLNTHQQWICRQLADLGYEVNRQTCVPDDAASIQQAVREALGRSDLVLTTGGLGPTSDDLTRELISQLLGRPLRLDPSILAGIEQYFKRRHGVIAESARVQAMVPEGALVLPNSNGTAPGLAIKLNPNPFMDGRRSWLILLPGPPRELRPMFLESVAPRVLAEFPQSEKFTSKTLKTTGMGESLVEEKIAGPLQQLLSRGLELGYCARIGEVEVRLSARGENAEKIISEAEGIVRERLRSLVFGENDETLEQTVVTMLSERRNTLALAESCTGGFVAHRVTNVPGASAVLKCGLVTYSNEAKIDLLSVAESSIGQHGAVSEIVAREMAEGALRRCKVDYAIAVTGIAGPGGGSQEKPVGTVFIAVADADGTVVKQKLNPFDRETFKSVTSQQALDLLRRRMLSQDSSEGP